MGLENEFLLKLKRFNTPTIYNGWEQVTGEDIARAGINLEETHDFMPQMGPMIGYAVTLTIEPSNPNHSRDVEAWSRYRSYVAGVDGPKIVVVQDLDLPRIVGSFWGEVNSNTHAALGCIGTITDGAIRDLDEMNNSGFKALARRLCVGHAHAAPVDWGGEVKVFGQTILPGQLIHADKHGFLAIPPGEEKGLLEAVKFMDDLECRTVISAARFVNGLERSRVLERIEEANRVFREESGRRFRRSGEWG